MPTQLEYWHPRALRDVDHPNYVDFVRLDPTIPQFPLLFEQIRVALVFLKMSDKSSAKYPKKAR